jgi:zinc transporter 9
MVAANPTSETLSIKIALSLLVGFAFMLIVEKFFSGPDHAHGHSHSRTPSVAGSTTLFSAVPEEIDKHVETPAATSNDHEFDVALSELESHEGMALAGQNGHSQGNGVASSRTDSGIVSMHDRRNMHSAASKKKAFPLTLGLVIHSLADGLALGASALPGAGEGGNTQLSIVVFLAIVVHKGMSVNNFIALAGLTISLAY